MRRRPITCPPRGFAVGVIVGALSLSATSAAEESAVPPAQPDPGGTEPEVDDPGGPEPKGTAPEGSGPSGGTPIGSRLRVEAGLGNEFGRGLGLGVEYGNRHAVALGVGVGVYGRPRGNVPIRGGPGVALAYRRYASGWYFGPSVGVHPHRRLDTIVTVQADVGYRWRFDPLTARAGIGLGLSADTFSPGNLGSDTVAPTGSLTLALGWQF